MPHGVPSTLELVYALRTFLEEDVMPGTEGRLSFMARVAGNVAAMVEREVVLGPIHDANQEARLRALGMRDDDELAAAVRRGDLDDRRGEVIELTLADVLEKLSIWNPRYVEPEDADQIVGITDPGAPTSNIETPKQDR
jgi:Domain of unknown function (DUF6285)